MYVSSTKGQSRKDIDGRVKAQNASSARIDIISVHIRVNHIYADRRRITISLRNRVAFMEVCFFEDPRWTQYRWYEKNSKPFGSKILVLLM
jgi:hypothetical protein